MNWLDRLRTLRGERAGNGAEEPLDPELSRLLERARDLPSSRQPERDLFLGIENRIAKGGALERRERWTLVALAGFGYGIGAMLFSAIEILPYGWRALYVLGVLPLLLLPRY